MLSAIHPIIRYLTENKKGLASEKSRLVAGNELEKILSKDIEDITSIKKKYSVVIEKLGGGVIVSERHQLREATEINYSRSLTKKEELILPFLGAKYGFHYLKKLDINSIEFESLARKIKPKKWVIDADYSYCASNTLGSTYKNNISLSEEIDTLDELIGLLGHEAGHSFSDWGRAETSESGVIEETICDFFAEEYKQYFKENHAGKYAPLIRKKKLEVSQELAIVSKIEDMLASKGTKQTEQWLMHYKGGAYNQAILTCIKKYSGDINIVTRVHSLFLQHGPRAVLLLPEVTTRYKLQYVALEKNRP